MLDLFDIASFVALAYVSITLKGKALLNLPHMFKYLLEQGKLKLVLTQLEILLT